MVVCYIVLVVCLCVCPVSLFLLEPLSLFLHSQLSSRFMPHPNIIKKRIESLIEREFLEREKDNWRMYKYLA